MLLKKSTPSSLYLFEFALPGIIVRAIVFVRILRPGHERIVVRLVVFPLKIQSFHCARLLGKVYLIVECSRGNVAQGIQGQNGLVRLIVVVRLSKLAVRTLKVQSILNLH